MKLKIEDIEQTFTLLMEHLRESDQTDFTIDQDYYWTVLTEGRFDPYKKPDELALGQLTHDWERLETILKGRDEPLGWALCWLASILRTMGEMTKY